MKVIYDPAKQKIPIKAWLDELDQGTLEQTLNLARLPFAVHHISLMPDAHLGYGMPIGGVLPTEGYVVPNAVGVDIGCFTGDTEVPLADGKSYPMAELAARDDSFVVYACTPSGRVVAATATAKLTRRNAPLVRATLDNGAQIRCTPDHDFMLRDGTYVEARCLEPGASLMPLDLEGEQHRPAALIAAHNHKVLSVEALDEREDVYCLTVPDYGNFALTAGVFVHNCGMHARRTNIEAGRLADAHPGQGTLLRAVLSQIQRAVPAGNGPVGNHKAPQLWEEPYAEAEVRALLESAPPELAKAWQDSRYQIGTLGGGNHFIEVQADEEGYVWLMLHSGSRALGRHVCDHYNVLARAMMARLHPEVPPQAQLAGLPLDTEEGQSYLRWMRLCMAYALENRRRMLDTAIDALFTTVRGVAPEEKHLITEAADTHHNFADVEHHFGTDMLIHRKGAVRAPKGELVIIPGSMETGSYIARGLGNPESFETASHGAGRRLSRTAAKKVRSAEDVIKAMKSKGIEIAKRSHADVAEEAGHAYKDIQSVMEDSRDLVEPVYKLRPLGVVKG